MLFILHALPQQHTGLRRKNHKVGIGRSVLPFSLVIHGKMPPFLVPPALAGAFFAAFRAAMLTSAERAATLLSCSLLAAGANAEALRTAGHTVS